MRKEEMVKLDLHPRDYVVYAYNALTRVVELLLEQGRGGRQAEGCGNLASTQDTMSPLLPPDFCRRRSPRCASPVHGLAYRRP
jgi:hypothetical protein